MKKWDVFISHASEDKKEVALPLAETLIRAGLRVWLDKFELTVGDSLREKIDEGLSESAFGVVILSEHFLNKGWPKNELNGLFALEEEGVKIVLPVWHKLDKATVGRYSPMLADRLAADTAQGIPEVARVIAQVVLKQGGNRRSAVTLVSQFVKIVDEGPSPLSVTTFLATYPRVLEVAFGGDYHRFLQHPALGVYRPDLTAGTFRTTLGDYMWCHLFFCPVQGPFFENGIPVGDLKQTIEKVRHLLDFLSDRKVKTAKALIPRTERWSALLAYFAGSGRLWHSAVILVGRRDHLSNSDRTAIRSLKDQGIEIRSYDWLIEACASAERESGVGPGQPLIR